MHKQNAQAVQMIPRGSSPVIPAPSELEVTQMMREPVDEPETQNKPPH